MIDAAGDLQTGIEPRRPIFAGERPCPLGRTVDAIARDARLAPIVGGKDRRRRKDCKVGRDIAGDAELAALIDLTAIGVEMQRVGAGQIGGIDRKRTRLNSSHYYAYRMQSSALTKK